MDDLILRAAIRQDGHCTDRSALLDCGPQTSAGAVSAVLVSFDLYVCMFFLLSVIEHMLMTFLAVRLKARARQLDAANEKDMAAIMKAGE